MTNTMYKEIINVLKDIKGILSIIAFGSSNNEDYIEGVSDFDFFIIVEEINYDILKDINDKREQLARNVDIDCKVISINEFSALQNEGEQKGLINGWGLESIKQGKQKILLGCEEIKPNIPQEIDIRIGAKERMYYYVEKLRKVMVTKEHLSHNTIQELNNTKRQKIIVSCIKNILTFKLAQENIYVYTNKELLAQLSEPLRSYMKEIFTNKENNKQDNKIITKTYNYVETMIR